MANAIRLLLACALFLVVGGRPPEAFAKPPSPALGPALDIHPLHSVPYGYAYVRDDKGGIRKMRAYPTRVQDMHVDPDPKKIADPSRIREAWRLAFSNPTKQKLLITNVELVQNKHEALPERFVCFWAQKGYKDAKPVDVQLKAHGTRYSLLSDGGAVELAPEETQLFLVKILSAEPGIYTFSFSITFRRGTSTSTLDTDPQTLFVPDREAPKGIHALVPVVSGDEVARRMLALGTGAFTTLATETHKSGSLDLGRAPAVDIASALKTADESRFLQFLKQWTNLAKPKASRDEERDPQYWAQRVMTPGITQALVLRAKEETLGEAIRSLVDYRVHSPEDADAVEMLMSLLCQQRKIKEAKDLWDELQGNQWRRSATYYRSGIRFGSCVGDLALQKRLATEARLTHPEDPELLGYRLHLLAAESAWTRLGPELARFCRHDLNGEFDSRSPIPPLVRRLSDLLSRQPIPSGRSGLEEVLVSCPASIEWALRANTDLWPLAPKLRFDLSDVPTLPPDEIKVAANALASQGRLEAVRTFLVDSIRAHPGDPSLRELLGDALARSNKHKAAFHEYRAAFEAKSRPSVPLTERVAAKQIWALCAADDSAGLKSLLAGLLPRLPASPPHPRFVALPPRAQAIVRTTEALFWGDAGRAAEGLKRWMDADPGDTFRDDYSVDFRRQVALLNDISEVLPKLGQIPQGCARIPSSLLERIRASYVELAAEQVSTKFRSTDEQWQEKRGTPWMMAELNAALAHPPETEAFIVKSRENLAAGLWDGKVYHVIDGGDRLTVEEWVKREQPNAKGAKAGVYLTPLTGARFRAEMKLFEARVAAFGNYRLSVALPQVEAVVADDPLNVDGWATLAALYAGTGQIGKCHRAAKQGLMRDPLFGRLKVLLRTCSAA